MGRSLTREEVYQRIKEGFQQNVELIGEYKNKRTPVQLHCWDCNHTWEVLAQSVLYLDKNRVKTFHQCPNCGINAKKRILVKCAYCGKEIERTPSDIEASKTGLFYCSRECGNKHKNDLRKASGEWEEGSSNYRARALETYENKCFCCGWDEDARILEAHHLDEDRANNKVSNLRLLCPTCHRKITLGYYYLDLENHKLVAK